MGKVKRALLRAGILDEVKIFSGGEFQDSICKSPKLIYAGEKKILALTQLTPTSTHRQMDIRLCPTQSLPYMLLGNSGDDLLMKIVRSKANSKGWLLNEYDMGERTTPIGGTVRECPFSPCAARNEADGEAMIKEGTEILVKDEKEIFEKLGLPYLPVRADYRSRGKTDHIAYGEVLRQVQEQDEGLGRAAVCSGRCRPRVA
jgi:DNA polymerase beta